MFVLGLARIERRRSGVARTNASFESHPSGEIVELFWPVEPLKREKQIRRHCDGVREPSQGRVCVQHQKVPELLT